MFYNLEKYILQFGQILFAIWTNIFSNLDKYCLQFGQIHLAIWTNIFSNLDKYVLQFGQIHFATKTLLQARPITPQQWRFLCHQVGPSMFVIFRLIASTFWIFWTNFIRSFQLTEFLKSNRLVDDFDQNKILCFVRKIFSVLSEKDFVFCQKKILCFIRKDFVFCQNKILHFIRRRKIGYYMRKDFVFCQNKSADRLLAD